jgi:hypothetical protein
MAEAGLALHDLTRIPDLPIVVNLAEPAADLEQVAAVEECS